MAPPRNHDVRMRGFQHRAEVAEALQLIDSRVQALHVEYVDLRDAAGRVLAEDVVAPCEVPGFDRAAMDGFALRAEETFGADGYTPLEFARVGESLPGRPFVGVVQTGQAVRIMTGAPLPAGADAVVQAEAAQEIGKVVRVMEPVSPGRHVGRRGEDIQSGVVLLRSGRRLRPQDVAVLASVGASPVPVVRQPRVAILVTGDELLPCGAKPTGYQIVDSNSVMLAALAKRDGAGAVRVQKVADRYDLVRNAVAEADEDVLLVSGGSSVGVEDHAPRVLAELGELTLHGVALRPASPTGLGFLSGRPVLLMPGNPVSCLCAYDLFAGRAIRRLGRRDPGMPYPTKRLPLARKIVSMVGRVDYVRVQVCDGRVEPLAISGASILSSTTRADGFVLVAADLEGHAEREAVLVHFYDQEGEWSAS
jgi:molybdopterin molybdotransferase